MKMVLEMYQRPRMCLNNLHWPSDEGLAIRLPAEGMHKLQIMVGRPLVNFHNNYKNPGLNTLEVPECLQLKSKEKDLVKELKRMSEQLEGLDKHPDEELSQDEANLLLGELELDLKLDTDVSAAVLQIPAPCSTRPTRSRRRVRRDETSSAEDDSPPPVQFVAPTNPGTISFHLQRASTTASLTKMTAKTIPTDEDHEEESSSEVMLDEDSGESDQIIE